jgi:ABC-type multidrug transport system fused ATPase/permease subunit
MESSLTSLVRSLVRPYRKWLIVVFGAMILETAMSLAAPWTLKVVLDSVVGHHPMPSWLQHLSGNENNKMALAGVLAIIVVLIAAVGAVASYINNYYTESIAQNVANDLRLKIYHHLQRLSLSYYDQHQSGTILSTITSDVSTIQGFASSSLLSILVDSMTIVGMLGLMFYLNWDFSLIAVATAPVLLVVVSRFKKAVKKGTHEVRTRQSTMLAVLQQGLESMRAVKAFGRQSLEEKKLEEVSLATVNASLKARRVKSLVSPLVAVMVSLCTAFVLYRGSSLVLSNTMTIGALAVFLSYLTKFFKPVQDLAKMTTTIAQASVGLERIQAILSTDSIIPQKSNPTDPGTLKGDISFEHVAFAYDPKAQVLNDIHFKIKPGQKIGVVGPTGGGKSTVVSLIPRFYDPTAGRVTIDGVDIADYGLEALRAQIAYVLQDTVLFYGTIRDNICYGRPDATDEEVFTAARLANADEFIERTPLGYDTMVGERGLTLSGGQRQRIGIARAVIRNSPILILDEPTAALDTESEQLVMEALGRLMKGRTVITIAHRLSTIRDADKIVVLKGGVVAEQGTHEELIALDGAYADLYFIQSGKKEHEPIHKKMTEKAYI